MHVNHDALLLLRASSINSRRYLLPNGLQSDINHATETIFSPHHYSMYTRLLLTVPKSNLTLNTFLLAAERDWLHTGLPHVTSTFCRIKVVVYSWRTLGHYSAKQNLPAVFLSSEPAIADADGRLLISPRYSLLLL